MQNCKTRINYKDLTCIVALIIIHLVFVFVYRPFIYSHYANIPDFSIVNIFPSIICVPIGYLFLKMISHKLISKEINFKQFGWKLSLLICVMIGNYLYEGLDIYMGSGDWYDMIGITIGGLVVLLISILKLKNK